MIDRSYLPFKSAREYQDVKMQKWMGFFLSEHTSALSYDQKHVDSTTPLTFEDKVLLITQAYTQQLLLSVKVIGDKTIHYYSGTVPRIDKETILLKTPEGHVSISIRDILQIQWLEEEYHESA